MQAYFIDFIHCGSSAGETCLPIPLMPLAPRARHLWRSISSGSVAVLANSADFFFISCSWRSVAAMIWKYRTGESLREKNVVSCLSAKIIPYVRTYVHAQMTSGNMALRTCACLLRARRGAGQARRTWQWRLVHTQVFTLQCTLLCRPLTRGSMVTFTDWNYWRDRVGRPWYFARESWESCGYALWQGSHLWLRFILGW